MKNFMLAFFLLAASAVNGQALPPAAQALYNEMFAMDTARSNYAIGHGAQISASPDSSSFILSWFPSTSQPDTLPLIVTLHGSDGNVFNEFFIWHPYAVNNNCGIIAIQWFMGAAAQSPYDYLEDSVIYHNIETALNQINYPSGKALLHGFSRGSARSYAINLYDMLSGNNFFCTTISNAGSAEPVYPLYTDINNGVYGPSPFLGRHWSLYCGGLDSGLQSNCNSMIATRNWLQAKGAIVDVFIQDPTGDHGGFHMNSANVDSIMAYYLQCFYGLPLGTEQIKREDFAVFPNPSSGNFFVRVPANRPDAQYRIEIYDGIGRMVSRYPLYSTQVQLHQPVPGNYTYIIFDRNLPVKRGKLIID